MRKKLIALFTSVILMMTMIIGSSVVFADAATKYDVPVKATYYTNENIGTDEADADNVEWKYGGSESYRYNSKGDLIKSGAVKSEWTYKKGKAVNVITGSKKLGERSAAVYKKGRISTSVFRLYNKKGKVTDKVNETFSYNNKEWISKYVEKTGRHTRIHRYSYKFYSNGMPKSITLSVKYDKKTVRAAKTTFNKKGLVKTINDTGDLEECVYTYDKKGRVKERIEKWEGIPMNKTVFTYGNATTKNKKTYIGVMNGTFMNGAVRDAIPCAHGSFIS